MLEPLLGALGLKPLPRNGFNWRIPLFMLIASSLFLAIGIISYM